MKLLKTLAVAAATFAFAFAAEAQTVIRITGSTAFRSATHNAIKNIITPASLNYGYTGSSLSSAGQAIFTGTVGANAVIIKTSWSGAVGGIQTVSQGLNVNFLADGATVSPTGTASLATGTTAEIPDVAMADNLQSSTPFTATTLTATKVGVIPFKWVASNGAPTGLNNITPQLAQVLFGNGSLSLALFTGLATDEGVKVFATGRDPDSGTRVICFAEPGIGVFSSVVQYQPTISGAAVTSHIPWPTTTVNGITFDEGNGGYPSGGTLATTMTKTTLAGIGGYYVSYMGTSDATTAVAGGAKELSYNGVTYSDAGVKNGSYTMWGYEYLMYKTTLAGVKKTVADTLANQILTVDSPVLISTMRVERTADGGNITPKY